MRSGIAAALLAALSAGPAAAQDRPGEDELFGKPAEQAAPAAPATAPAGKRDDAILGASGQTGSQPARTDAAMSEAKENPLAVGGLLYLRAASTWQEGYPPAEWVLSSPDLLDVFLDVRPNDRVRGFVLGRMIYDPTYDPNAPIPGNLFAGKLPNPRGLLDQLWVNFDVGRTVFVTDGKQHVKWGVGHFWNPTDFLHPVKRNPLDPFDARTGVTMVKAHLPWEARGWNLYGVAVLEDVAGRPVAVNTIGRAGGGARAEMVLGTAEIGADAVVQRDNRPRFGVDFSAGIWDLDLYGEAALRTGADVPHVRSDGTTYELQGFQPQVLVGGSWSWKYSDEDTLTLGGEYFYNAPGYEDGRIYPALGQAALQGKTSFNFFYLGQRYAGAYLLLPKPGSWNDTTFTLSALANLSDRSYIVRLDHSVVLNTYLRLETYVAGHLGREGGEFRFAAPALARAAPPDLAPLLQGLLRPPVLDLGVALRVSL
jgi:hypothetical protein